MAQAKSGDKVAVYYTGKLTDGTVFDSSEGREPLEFELGSGMVIKGFDDGITGMALGEKKSVHIPAEDAYGHSIEENILTIERSTVPPEIELELGLTLNMHQDGTGQVVQVTVTDLTETSVTLDANHPLAGKDLIFDIELIGINQN